MQTNRNPFVDQPELVTAAFIPRMAVARTGNDIWLSWTNDYTPSLLVEQSADLKPVWLAITNASTLTSTNTWTITLPMDGRTRFFRYRLN